MLLALWLAIGCGHQHLDGALAPSAVGDDVWEIEGQPVTQAVWTARVEALVGEQQDWMCAETTTGGITSYIRRDSAGVRWLVSEESDSRGPDTHALRHADLSR